MSFIQIGALVRRFLGRRHPIITSISRGDYADLQGIQRQAVPCIAETHPGSPSTELRLLEVRVRHLLL